MKSNLNNLNIKKVDAPYPIAFINNFLTSDKCNELFKEISAFKGYDDVVMNGRHRVNKGSKKFKEYLNKFEHLGSFYKEFNTPEIFKLMKEKLDEVKKANSWQPELNELQYSNDNFGEQDFNLIKYLRKSWPITKFFKQTINLDIDFSKSKKGYYRKAHRDRDTRIISFLLYLNTIDKELGGEFEIYKFKNNNKKLNDLKRFPEENEVNLIDKFSPKSGQLFFFLSTPDSYHGVSKFLSEDTDRVFIYGSYSLDRKVVWKFNDK